MNKVILMGRLTRDPEIRYTQSSKAVATFTIAVDRRGARRNSEGQQQQPTADFIPIVAWERLAEFCGNYLLKGSPILVEGRMQTRTYDAPDGSKRYITEVVAENIEFAGPRPDGAGAPGAGGNRPMNNGGGFQGGHSQAPANQAPSNDFGTPLPADDDIPF